MNVVRMSIGAALALIVTFALFVLMYTLIESGDTSLDDEDQLRLPDILMPNVEIDENITPPKPDKPDKPEEPPPELDTPDVEVEDLQVDSGMGMVDNSRDFGLGEGIGINVQDGEYLPIVKVQPQYPRRAAERGIQGYCTVVYTVTKQGSVRDPEIAIGPDGKEDCSSPYFKRASKSAALKFKYKPRVVDGEAIEVPNIHNRFIFKLDR